MFLISDLFCVSLKDIISSGEDIIFSGEDIISSGEDIISSGEDIISSGEDIISSGEEINQFKIFFTFIFISRLLTLKLSVTKLLLFWFTYMLYCIVCNIILDIE